MPVGRFYCRRGTDSCSPEAAVNFKKNESAQKLRGGYYTPMDLAEFLVRWVKEIRPKRILEPSCGDGAFLTALKTVGIRNADVLAFELNAVEAGKAREKLVGAEFSAIVKATDFLGYATPRLDYKDEQFDAAIGNPPFVRYQYLPAEFQGWSEKIFKALHCDFTKHTNAWVPFILASMAMLRPGGRLAMVVPAEIIHVMHAQSLRAYLGRECSRMVIIDPEELWFQNTLQGAVILLAQKRRSADEKAEGVAVLPVRSREFLDNTPRTVFTAPTAINGKTVQGKWTRALLTPPVRSLIDAFETNKGVHRFDNIATVDVGIVTGANKFFLVDDETVERFNLSRWAYPMFGRSEHCPGIVYDDKQHAENARVGNPTNFLWFDKAAGKDPDVQAYIKSGEDQELHTRFKCRIRKPWYTVPSVYSTEIGMLKRSHNMPRLILNKAGAYTTDTAYRIRSSKVKADYLVACFLNPLTAVSAELEGRHYGGGVLELVPSEIEKMLIPVTSKLVFDLPKLDDAVRTMPMDDLVSQNGQMILTGIGASKQDVDCLMAGWQKLRNRRHRTTYAEA